MICDASAKNVAKNIYNIALAYIGSIVPDEQPYHNIAFSRAGNMCQLSLIKGLIKGGLPPDAIHSVRPAASFPRSQQVLFHGSYTTIKNIIRLNFIPFINITPIKQFTIGVNTLLALLKWGWRFRNNRDRIVFTFNISVPPGIFTLLAARLTWSKAVAMIYDIDVPGETVPRRLSSVINYWQHNKILKKYDGLVVITNAIAQDFAPGVPYLRVEGGVSHDLIAQYQALDAIQRRSPAYFTIVTAGRLDEDNGIREIMAAFSLIQGEGYRLHIAGAGPLESVVKDAAERDPRISFHGFLPFDEVLKLYAAADVLVNMRLTQRINTRYFFPSKTMEFLASGVPLITTCPGNMAEEYGEFAYLLHEETADALADMLKSVAAIPEEQRVARGRAARQYMSDHKTWEAQAIRIVGFLKGIAEKGREAE